MDVGTIFAYCITTAMAIGGMAISSVAIVSMRRIIKQQANALTELATRKPYWIIEKDDRGIVSINTLASRVEDLEKVQKFEIEAPVPPAVEKAMLENQWNKDDMDVPPMTAEDVPINLGTRE